MAQPSVLADSGGRSARRGVTLVETLVVIAILAVLLALTAGAVQRVRATAARTQCANNLCQVALALHGYHDAQGHLPAGRTDYYLPNSKVFDDEATLSWSERILPQLGEGPLWQQYRAVWPGVEADPLSAARVAVLLCPADPVLETPGGTSRRGAPLPVSAAMSYVGVAGSGLRGHIKIQDGVLYRGSAVRFADVSDGTANTLMLAERHGSDSPRTGVWGVPRGGGNAEDSAKFLNAEDVWDLTSTGDCPNRPGRFGPGSPADVCDLIHYWSSHPGGANFALCDGSVRFLRYGAADTLPALATRSGGEAIEPP